ncbi:MAG TPA: GrpB family protein [Candidatus Mediterraneibacter surreyensis]|nr:GrpB family protein [Candidatus Mediterraneibacter surreyensis]
MARKIEVTDYRPEWESMFKEEAKKIKKILGKNCIGIYHIGSTSVKNMASKPIIDIMPVVKDLSLVDAHNKGSYRPDVRHGFWLHGQNR